MFQFRRFPTYAYLIQRRLTRYCRAGFPHSEISGSKPMCGSPKLIAACHVLHRLLMPRHSPCALISLTSPARFPRLWSTKSGSQESCRLQSLRLIVFTHLFPQFALLCCLLFHSGIITSHCSVFKVRAPTFSKVRFQYPTHRWVLKSALTKLVGQSGLEPPTSRLSVVCSSQLSYWPSWWRLPDSNR